jgi:phospholipid/cholesterol/gamma-HCH transport system ATP-binding protein
VHETAQLADYVVIIFQGKIIGAGTPDEVIHNSSEQVQQFVQGLADGPVTFHYPAKDYREELLR